MAKDQELILAKAVDQSIARIELRAEQQRIHVVRLACDWEKTKGERELRQMLASLHRLHAFRRALVAKRPHGPLH